MDQVIDVGDNGNNIETPDSLQPSIIPTASDKEMDVAGTSTPINNNHELVTITGIVENLSGNDLPEGLKILLYAFDEHNLVFTDTVNMGDDGIYFFNNVEALEGRLFQTSVEFDGIIYGSEPVVINESQSPVELPIVVYEVTTETSVLNIERLHYFFELIDDDNLRVVEVYVISNDSNKTLIAPQNSLPVIGFHLPVGAKNLEIQNGKLGDRFILTSTGFGDTTPILPGLGDYQIMYSYTLPYSRNMRIGWPVILPIKALVILVPGDNLSVKGNKILDVGIRDIQGTPYHFFEGGDFTPGQEIGLSITKPLLDLTPLSIIGSNFNLLIGLSSLVITCIIGVVWIRHGKRKEKCEMDATLMKQNEFDDKNPDMLMDAILALDDLYQSGSLPEEVYIQRREELKTRLESMMGS